VNSIGVISYGIAAAAFTLLSILLGISWRGRSAGVFLIAASAVTAVWASLLALVGNASDHLLSIFTLEMLRNASWLLALSVIATSTAPRGLVLAARWMSGIVAVIAVTFPFLVSRGVILGDVLLSLSRTGLIVTLLGLVLLEQVYRNSSEASRPSLRYLVLGVGGIFAYDLFLYSQAELLRGITTEAWYARGIIDALSVPALAIAARRSPQWSLDVFVSRQAVFYSTSFVGLGIYLVLMSLGGYYVREIGGQWGRIGQILFFVGAAVVLVFLVASAPLRRHARVFISKHFYRNKYDYRLEWLRFIGTLSSEGESDVRRTAVRAIAQIFGSPGGVLFSLDEQGNRYVAAAAWPMSLNEIEPLADLPDESPLPRFMARTRWIIDLQEFNSAPDVYHNVDLPDWVRSKPGLRLILPLLQHDRLAGLVLLFEPPPPFDLTYEDRDLLKTLGRHVATHLAQHDSDRRLAESRQFEAYNRLTAFMMHDLKNSVAQLQLVVANADRHKNNPEFIDDAIATIANTVERMRRLIEQLAGKSVAAKLQRIDVAQSAREAIEHCSARVPQPTLSSPESVYIRGDRERFTAVLEHLIRNAQDACNETDTIAVEIANRGGAVELFVSDTGSGMAAEFVRERLFRPFDSTKGSKGMGIGAYQVREYIRSLGGQLEVQSSPGHGTRFSIRLSELTDAPERSDANERVLS
jgi:putative PEP-CTERM system histidine kinase